MKNDNKLLPTEKFDPAAKSDYPAEETLEAINEIKAAKANQITLKSYDTVEEMMDALFSENDK